MVPGLDKPSFFFKCINHSPFTIEKGRRKGGAKTTQAIVVSNLVAVRFSMSWQLSDIVTGSAGGDISS